MKDIMKIVKYFEESSLLNKVVWKIIEYEVEQQNAGFIDMLAATSVASLLRNILAGKGVIWTGEGIMWAGEGTIRAGQDFWWCLMMSFN